MIMKLPQEKIKLNDKDDEELNPINIILNAL